MNSGHADSPGDAYSYEVKDHRIDGDPFAFAKREKSRSSTTRLHKRSMESSLSRFQEQSQDFFLNHVLETGLEIPMVESNPAFAIDQIRAGKPLASIGLINLPPPYQDLEIDRPIFHAVGDEFLDCIEIRDVGNRYHGEIILFEPFLEVLEMRKLRTAPASPGFPEIDQYDIPQMVV